MKSLWATMSPTGLILFEDFIRVPLGILSIFGIELTADVKKSKRNPTVFACVSFVCVLILFTQAIIFTHIHFGQKEFFIKLIYDFATMGFAFLCCLKVFMVFIRKNSVLLESMNMLDALLPRDLKIQSKFKIKKNYKNLKSQNFVYEILMPLLLVIRSFAFPDISFQLSLLHQRFWTEVALLSLVSIRLARERTDNLRNFLRYRTSRGYFRCFLPPGNRFIVLGSVDGVVLGVF